MPDDEDRRHMETRGRSRMFTLRGYLWAVKTKPERLAGVARWRMRGLTFREIALKFFDQGASGSFEKRHQDLQALIARVRYTWLVWAHLLSSSQVVFLYAVTMTLTVFLLREK